jgi:hypothetical protein
LRSSMSSRAAHLGLLSSLYSSSILAAAAPSGRGGRGGGNGPGRRSRAAVPGAAATGGRGTRRSRPRRDCHGASPARRGCHGCTARPVLSWPVQTRPVPGVASAAGLWPLRCGRRRGPCAPEPSERCADGIVKAAAGQRQDGGLPLTE